MAPRRFEGTPAGRATVAGALLVRKPLTAWTVGRGRGAADLLVRKELVSRSAARGRAVAALRTEKVLGGPVIAGRGATEAQLLVRKVLATSARGNAQAVAELLTLKQLTVRSWARQRPPQPCEQRSCSGDPEGLCELPGRSAHREGAQRSDHQRRRLCERAPGSPEGPRGRALRPDHRDRSDGAARHLPAHRRRPGRAPDRGRRRPADRTRRETDLREGPRTVAYRKASDEQAAVALGSDDFWAAVQNGGDVRISVADILALPAHRPRHGRHRRAAGQAEGDQRQGCRRRGRDLRGARRRPRSA